MKSILIYTCLVFLSFSTVGQINYIEKKANEEYEKEHYYVAQKYYEEILAKDSLSRESEIKLADCYRRLLNYSKTEKAYKKLIDKNGTSEPVFYHYYAEALANNKKYEEARIMYQKYDSLNNENVRSGNYKDINSLVPDSSAYQVEFMPINSRASDFSPMYYHNGIVFCSGRHLKNGVRRVFSYDQSAYLDLFYVEDTNAILNPKLFQKKSTSTTLDLKHINHDDITEETSNDSKTVGTYRLLKIDSTKNDQIKLFDKKLNSKYHEGPLTFYTSEDSIIFTRNNQQKQKNVGGPRTKTKTRLKLYTANHTDKGWRNIRELPFNNNNYSVGHPSLSPDNKKLYFVSDMPGGMGGTDIYVSEYVNSTWSLPVNMGSRINTKGNEMFPFIDHNGNLYYSSNGRGGLGGLDIFFYRMNDSLSRSKPKNMGAPINSSSDDFGIIMDRQKRTGYFSSNRKNGGTDDDIYGFIFTPPTEIRLKGIVSDTSKAPIYKALVIFVQAGDTIIADTNGLFQRKLKPETDYTVFIKKEGYKDKKDSISTKDLTSGTLLVNYELEKIPEEQLKKEFLLSLQATIKTFQGDTLPENITLKVRNLKTGRTSEYPIQQIATYTGILEENSDYELVAETNSRKTNTLIVSTWGRTNGDTVKTILSFMSPREIDDCEKMRVKYFIESIYYDEAKYEIPTYANATMEKALQIMKKYTAIKLIISSHTDSKGGMYDNEILSRNRTKSVYDYLVKNGISSTRLIQEFYGEQLPVNNCSDSVDCPDASKRLNRRTEFYVIKDNINITKDCKWILYDVLANASKEGIVANVFFDFDKSGLSNTARESLDYVASFMKKNTGVKLYASAHTDSKGSDRYNLVLSEKRLAICINYLVQKGISANRIKGESFGESKPFNKCSDGVECTTDEHLFNRRTQFSILLKIK